jgi:23S rRNA (uridine2479-2'-O)-methyltransferase
VLRRNRQKRTRYGEFFVEGVRPINTALDHGWDFSALYYAPGRPLSGWARDVLDQAGAETHYELTPELMDRLSEKEETSEIIAILKMPADDLSRIPVQSASLVVLFDRPVSPGNLGSLIRSGDALGAAGTILSGHGADLYDPETIRASRGSLFALPSVRVGGPEETRIWLDRVRMEVAVQVVGTDENGDLELWEMDWRKATLIALGNETWGLSAAYREMCEAMVRIPMTGAASSLNVASAGSIVLYEALRQRNHHASDRPRP